MAPRSPFDDMDMDMDKFKVDMDKFKDDMKNIKFSKSHINFINDIQKRIKINARDIRIKHRAKFYPDDPNDCWDTGRMSRRDRETLNEHSAYNPIGNFRDRRKPVREPERKLVFNLENIGRRIRNMSGKISIPVIPILIAMWIFDPFGFFEDDEDVKTNKPSVEITEKKTFKEEVRGVMDTIEKKVIPVAKEKWEQAKEELKDKKDEPDPIPVAKSDDPYAQDDNKYGGTTNKY